MHVVVLYYKCSKQTHFGDLMGVPVRIENSIYNAAKKTAKAEFRSVPHQIEYWARIGKCALDNPDLPIEFIKELLMAKNTDKSLTESFNFGSDNE